MKRPTTDFTLKVTETGSIEQIKDDFKKIELVGDVVPQGDYPNVLKVQGVNEMAEKLKEISPGDVVSLTCTISGRRWQGEDREIIFMNLNVINYNVIESGSGVPEKEEEPKEEPNSFLDNQDDLPF